MNSILKSWVLKIKEKEIELKDDWLSYDRAPWDYPWLTEENLQRFKNHSDRHREKLINKLDSKALELNYGVFGNMANSMYTRATVLRQKDIACDVVLHPQDNYVMSQPAWEEYDGNLVDESRDYKALVARQVLPPNTVQSVFQYADIGELPTAEVLDKLGISEQEHELFTQFMLSHESYEHLNSLAASICAQSLFFGYFSGSPYAAVSLGGDLWMEASRGDALGYLQRAGFSNANYILASDPLTIASCRRFGFRNAIYIPHYLDEKFYSPGPANLPDDVDSKFDGDFNILSSGRLDVSTKGSNIGAEAIVRFLSKFPNARLLQLAWGNDIEKMRTWFDEHGVGNQVVWLHVSGKKRLVRYLRKADCFIGQFVLGAYGHADLEAMASGVPVIGYINPKTYGVLCTTGCPPVINTNDSEGVYQGLERLYTDIEYRNNLGAELRKWFLANHGSERWYLDHLAVLYDMAQTGRKPHRNPALPRWYSAAEKEYISEQLKGAPDYPNYLVG